jgi:hypothetical protein
VNALAHQQPRDKQRFDSLFAVQHDLARRYPSLDPYHEKMAESERAKSLKQDADRLTELRRFL